MLIDKEAQEMINRVKSGEITEQAAFIEFLPILSEALDKNRVEIDSIKQQIDNVQYEKLGLENEIDLLLGFIIGHNLDNELQQYLSSTQQIKN